jgi:propionyl-CoA carboxylase alpha chain
MIRKLLVANRGEIARRIFATCREMGIATVAVYSEPDRHAPFVREADEGVALGGSSAGESYLRIESVVEAALRTGADAVHPGYGFLAENAAFARAVLEAGLVWIGPSPEAIAAMGSKLESKRLVEASGVATLPSVDLTDLDDTAIREAAESVGYPVLVKASAGGGGKGMRIVRGPDALLDDVRGAEREAASAFGDGTVFLERYLDAPRHIEIQVFGDRHGNVVSLFERECSIQRRHQKIIEESPSPAIDEDLRLRMGEAAVAAARTVDYVGAGTVEFLFQDGEFFFLEMNTRLQVEHPVTEEITGLDLVRLQLLVAEGEPLPPEAMEPEAFGHAVEVRIYAEDPRNGFLPATGTVSRFRFADEVVRVDSGVEDGSEVTPHYDPMIAKVIAWGPTRHEAAARLAAELRHAELHGVTTNRDLLVRILEHPEFLAGDTDTHFLERHDPALLGRPLPDEARERRAAVAAALAAQAGRRAATDRLAAIPSGWRNSPSQPQIVVFEGDSSEIAVGYRFTRDGPVVEVDGAPLGTVRLGECTPNRVALEVDGLLTRFRIRREGAVHHVDGATGYSRLVEHERFPLPGIEEEPGSLLAPMPGRVVKVLVAEGDEVEEGRVLVVMEAMKMEHSLRAPHAGIVRSVRAAEGDQVDAEQVLVLVEP